MDQSSRHYFRSLKLTSLEVRLNESAKSNIKNEASHRVPTAIEDVISIALRGESDSACRLEPEGHFEGAAKLSPTPP